jgi:hypothetical protein
LERWGGSGFVNAAGLIIVDMIVEAVSILDSRMEFSVGRCIADIPLVAFWLPFARRVVRVHYCELRG